MTDQHDQVQDEVGRALRIALAAAAALADRIARAHRDRDIAVPTPPAATPGGQGQPLRWDTARAAADAAAADVATAIRARTGLDVSGFTASPDTVRAALQHVEDHPAAPARAAGRDDVAAAITAVTTANRLEQAGSVDELTDLYRLGQQYRQAVPTAEKDAAELQATDRAPRTTGRGKQVAVLLAEADRYERDAAVPGLDPRTVDRLQSLAVDARSQADLYRHDPVQPGRPASGDQQAASSPTPVPTVARYDSHERRLADRDARIAAGVPVSTADTALQADFAQAVPPQAAIATRAGQDSTRSVCTHRDRGRDGTSREDRSR